MKIIDKEKCKNKNKTEMNKGVGAEREWAEAIQ